MGRPYGTKNVMRTPTEKEQIVLEYKNGKNSIKSVAEKHGTSRRIIQKWIRKYEEKGINGLESKTGKHNNPNTGKYNRHPSEEDKLKREIAKLEIEVARLKKGYLVKGVGDQKEYVTTQEKNTK